MTLGIFLTPSQYDHVADQVKALAMEKDPTHPVTVRVEAIEDFYELKEKGGPILGNLNVRVYFTVDKQQQQIVVLGACRKDNEGKPCKGVVFRIRRRLAAYRDGTFARPL